MNDFDMPNLWLKRISNKELKRCILLSIGSLERDIDAFDKAEEVIHANGCEGSLFEEGRSIAGQVIKQQRLHAEAKSRKLRKLPAWTTQEKGEYLLHWVRGVIAMGYKFEDMCESGVADESVDRGQKEASNLPLIAEAKQTAQGHGIKSKLLEFPYRAEKENARSRATFVP